MFKTNEVIYTLRQSYEYTLYVLLQKCFSAFHNTFLPSTIELQKEGRKKNKQYLTYCYYKHREV
jgi:hypothetical protein